MVLADEGHFIDDQHRLRYCLPFLKGDAYTTTEPYVTQTSVAFANTIFDHDFPDLW